MLGAAICSLTQPSKSNPSEAPLLSWTRVKGSLKLFSNELDIDGKSSPAVGIKYKFYEGSLFKTPEKKVESNIFGIPVHGKMQGKVVAGEAGAQVGLGEKGYTAGAYGDFYALKGEADGVLGTKNAGLTGGVGAKGAGFEGFVGLKDNQFGAKVGVNLASVDGSAGLNIAGVNARVKGEVGLKAELGFEVGAKGVEAKLPFVSFGISFGAAK